MSPPNREANSMTRRALLRHGRFEQAARETSVKMVRGWHLGDRLGITQRVGTPDEWAADSMKFGKDAVTILRRRDGRVVQVVEPRLDIPAWEFKNGSRLYWGIETLVENLSPTVPPDPVVETIIDGDRAVFLHSYVDRFLQRLIVNAVSPWLEAQLSPHLHSYRPRRSRWTALEDARHAVRKGYQWVAAGDVKKFFPSIKAELVEAVLADKCPWMAADLRDLIISTLFPVILRRPSHPEVKAGLLPMVSKPMGVLLQGSVIAPLLSNLVGHVLIDEPLQMQFGGDIVCVRSADDFRILGKEAETAERALDLVRANVEDVGMALQPKKTKSPRNVMREEVEFLGKVMVGKQVKTPKERFAELVEEVVAADPITHLFRRTAFNVLDELKFDGEKRIDDLRRAIKDRSPILGTVFSSHMLDWRAARRVHPPQDYDDFEDAVGVEVEEGCQSGSAASAEAPKQTATSTSTDIKTTKPEGLVNPIW